MAGKAFRCKLITPEAQVLDEELRYASIPAWDGLFGVLPGRAPIVAKLGLGELRLDFADSAKGQGGTRSFLVQDGFVQMVEDRLTILARRATPVEAISESEAQSEFTAAASKTPAAGHPNPEGERARLAAERRWAEQKLRLARRASGRAI